MAVTGAPGEIEIIFVFLLSVCKMETSFYSSLQILPSLV